MSKNLGCFQRVARHALCMTPSRTTKVTRLSRSENRVFQIPKSNGDMEASSHLLNDGEALALVIKRCMLLLDELQQFQSYLKVQGKEQKVEIKPFKTALQSEMKSLEKVKS